MAQRPSDLIYFLPIDQTVVQKELVEIMVQLHRPSILKILDKLKEEPVKPDPAMGPVLNDNVMLETFVSNVKQIGNHPTLLVNHFIPNNLLLLDTKENLIDSSSKYVKLDEILNRLTERKQQKTVIISVSNGKELDLVESILIGKNGLQYYRFSGASIYYENHGSFDFSKQPHSDEEEFIQEDRARRHNAGNGPNGAAGSVSGHGNGSGRSKSNTPHNGGHRGRKKHAKNGSANHGNGNGSGSGSGSGRKRSRSNSRQPQHRNGADDYRMRISKNSPLYQKVQDEKNDTKLSVYLILSNQLKNLAEFEELKSDFIISLDSNLEQIPDPRYQVPILKLIITNSLEYFDQQLKREVPTLRASPEIYNKFLTYLTVAYRSDVNTRVSNKPLQDDVIEWMEDVQGKPFPSDVEFPTFPVASLKIEELTRKCDESMQQVRFELPYNLEKYEFFDPSLKPTDAATAASASTAKRVKVEPTEVPAEMSYRQYQKLLAKMVYDRAISLSELVKERQKTLQNVNLDDSRRQHTLETNSTRIGEMYKKYRTDKTTNESMGKQLDRLHGDVDKLKELSLQLKQRSEVYAERVKGEIDPSALGKKTEEVEDLKKQIEKLEVDVKEDNGKTDTLRSEYQTKSSEAAALSLELKALDTRIEQLTKESNGLFMRLAERRVDDEVIYLGERSKAIERDNQFLERYIAILEDNLKDREKNGPQTLRNRGSRSGTPY